MSSNEEIEQQIAEAYAQEQEDAKKAAERLQETLRKQQEKEGE
jgi:hypothetical protein